MTDRAMHGGQDARRPLADGEELECELSTRQCLIITFRREGRAVGYVQLHASASHVLEVVDLFVEPSERGKGYGRRILEHCLELARQMGATVLTAHTAPENGAAYHLFLSLGFQPAHAELHLERQL